jgi:hypothetical protein
MLFLFLFLVVLRLELWASSLSGRFPTTGATDPTLFAFSHFSDWVVRFCAGLALDCAVILLPVIWCS